MSDAKGTNVIECPHCSSRFETSQEIIDRIGMQLTQEETYLQQIPMARCAACGRPIVLSRLREIDGVLRVP